MSSFFKIFRLGFVLVIMSMASQANAQVKLDVKQGNILDVIESYSKATHQKFIVDPGVRGQISIFLNESVSKEEGFNQLSSALALNSVAIVKNGDTYLVMGARNAQRSGIEVTSDLPKIKPERMITWIYETKNKSAEEIMHHLRILPSKDGELVIDGKNKLVLTDWVSNLHRVAKILKKTDVK